MSNTDTQHPTSAECRDLSIRVFKGVELGLGQADPGADIAATLEERFPGHLVLIQRGTFLQGYDRTAYALHTLKQYKLKLVGTIGEPHIRVGFPAGGFKRRLWAIMEEFGIPYVVSLGNQTDGRTIYASENATGNVSVLSSVSDQIVADVIHELRAKNELNKAGAKLLLSNPETSGFKLKLHAQDLDGQLLQDIIRMPRDLRVTYGENIRVCMGRIMRCIFAYGREENKMLLLKAISADVDLVKHYLEQGQRLSGLKVAFEHRAGLAVELGRLVGGLLKSASVQP